MFEQICPSPEDLSGFVLGTLPLPKLEGVARHLEACPVCEAAVGALERISDPVVAAIRHSGVGSSVLAAHSVAIGGPPVPERLGDFQIIREIGRGGMGFVYEAQQVSLGRRVALKILPRHSHLEPESLERFRRESRAVAGLHHTNIVQVFGTGQHDGLHYFVMELIPGVGLDKVLRELKQTREVHRPAMTIGGAIAPDGSHMAVAITTGQARSPDPSLMAVVRGLLSGTSSGLGAGMFANRDDLPAQECRTTPAPAPSSSSSGSGRPYWVRLARVAMQVAEALAHAHAYGVIHRDIKPSNLLIDYRGTVWVADFGLAKAGGDENVLTQSGDIIGTLRYLPPECLDGKADARGDVYSLGVTLYELVTLRDAFPDVDRNVLLRRKLDAELPRPRRENPNVPRDLETIILKAIARDPGHRYQTAADLAADLRRFVEDRPVRARRITAPERLWRWCRRDPRTASLLAVLLLALTAGLLGVSTQWRRAEQKARDETLAHARADLAQERARAELYLGNIAQSRLEWRLNNVAGAERLLDRCEPERRGWEWQYLRGVNRPELATLTNPGLSMVFGVAFSPDGRFLAFTGWDYYGNNKGDAPTPVVIWDMQSDHLAHTFSVPGAGLRPTFSPDGRLLAVSSSWHPVQLWDAVKGTLVREWEQKGIASFSPDGRRLAVGGSQAISICEVPSGRPVHQFPSQGGRVCFSPDGRLLAVSGKQAVDLRSAESGDLVGRLPNGPGDQVDLYFPELGPELAFSPDGKLLVSATSPPRLWEVAARRQLTTLGGHAGIVPGVAFSPDGRQIATAGADATVRLWNAQTGSELAVLRGHTGMAACVAFHPDGHSIVSGGRQPGDVKLWDLTRHPEHLNLDGGGPQALTFDAGGRLNVLSITGRLQAQDPESGQTVEGPRIELLQKWISPATLGAFSGDGRLLAAVSADLRTVKVFETKTGHEQAALRGLDALPVQVAFSQDGHRVAATTRAGSRGSARAVRVWDAKTGLPLALYQPAKTPAPGWHGAVGLSPDGRHLAFDDYQVEASAGAHTTTCALVRVCDAAGESELCTVTAGNGGISCLAFSPDGLLLAAGGTDGRVLVWDIMTGRRRYEDRLDLPAFSLAFNIDSRRLAGVSRESVTIWDMTTGKGILTLRAAPPRPTDLGTNAAVTWSHDGRWLAASNWDGTVAVWDGNSQAVSGAVPSHRQVPAARVYSWHLRQAQAALAARQPAAAAFHLDRLSAADPPDLASRRRRARLYLRRGDWDRAFSDYATVFSISEPDDSSAWLDYARVLVLRDDRSGYKRLIPRMLAHCGGNDDISRPEWEEVRARVLAPGAQADPMDALRQAERLVASKQIESADDLLSLALCHYRAGQWQKAIAQAEDMIARNPAASWSSWPLLAMAHARMGHQQEARRWLEKAEERRRDETQRRVDESFGFVPQEWADFEIFRREAADIIGQ